MDIFTKYALNRAGLLVFGLLLGCCLPALAFACDCDSGCTVYNPGHPYATSYAQAFDPGYTSCACMSGDDPFTAFCHPDAGTAAASCTCKSGYIPFMNSGTQSFCEANGFSFPCGQEPDVSTLAAACQCKSGYAEYSDPAGPGKFCSVNGNGYRCGAEPDLSTSTMATLSTALSTSVDTTQISTLGNNADGKQLNSLATADEVAALGAGQAATVGAVFCAQGANANLTNSGDANSFYASCIQNFDAAKGLSPQAAGYRADQSILDGEAAQQSLLDFEKNFGVPKDDYLKRMLGSGGGPASLSGMVDGKIPEAKLAEALEAAGKMDASGLSQSDKFVVNLSGSGPGKAKNTLRDNLKKKLSDTAEARTLASSRNARPIEKPTLIGDKEHLEPLGAEALLGSAEDTPELTIFDVVHEEYVKLAPRLHR